MINDDKKSAGGPLSICVLFVSFTPFTTLQRCNINALYSHEYTEISISNTQSYQQQQQQQQSPHTTKHGCSPGGCGWVPAGRPLTYAYNHRSSTDRLLHHKLSTLLCWCCCSCRCLSDWGEELFVPLTPFADPLELRLPFAASASNA